METLKKQGSPHSCLAGGFVFMHLLGGYKEFHCVSQTQTKIQIKFKIFLSVEFTGLHYVLRCFCLKLGGPNMDIETLQGAPKNVC